MKLLLIADDGSVLDSTEELTREEWENLSPAGAMALLGDLSAGA